MTAAPFTTETIRHGRTARVVVRGALDIASAPGLQAALDAAIESGIARLVVDLRELDFMDSAGLSVALNLSRRAQRSGFEVAFIPGPPRVQRVFELSAVASVLTFCDPPHGPAG
jgi:anti-sigma B factor antagonist